MMYRGVALSCGCQRVKFDENIFSWCNQSRNLWLKKGKFFPLCPKVENVQWLQNMALLVDVLQYQEWLNLSLHWQRKLMSYLGKAIFLSKRKVPFPETDLKSKKLKTSSMYEKKYRYLCLTVQWKLLLMTLDGLAEENDGRFKDLRAVKSSLPVCKIPFS